MGRGRSMLFHDLADFRRDEATQEPAPTGANQRQDCNACYRHDKRRLLGFFLAGLCVIHDLALLRTFYLL
ncbi:hypothetical protein D3C80_2120890 [compost metagenome]